MTRSKLYDLSRLTRHYRQHGCLAAVLHRPSIDSTNEWAKRVIGHLAHRTLLLAGMQTHGKGRFRRSWYSPPGGGVYASWVWTRNPGPDIAVFLNFAAAWALYEEICSLLPTIRCVWPNDLVLGTKKVAGILVETVGHGRNLQGIVVGFGVNLHRVTRPYELERVAISLEEAGVGDIDATALLIGIVDRLRAAEQMWYRDQGQQALKAWFQEWGWSSGTELEVNWNRRKRHARIREIRKDGSLVVQFDAATTLELPIEQVLNLQ